jgi:hypothetical protein
MGHRRSSSRAGALSCSSWNIGHSYVLVAYVLCGFIVGPEAKEQVNPPEGVTELWSLTSIKVILLLLHQVTLLPSP